MPLNRVTITGADDSIEPTQLIKLTEQYPFVEWGILVSQSSMGKPRFPSEPWLNKLRLLTRVPHQLPLSLHICGKWVRQLLAGVDAIPPEMLHGYSRVQLNFHAERTDCSAPISAASILSAWREKYHIKQVIFQIDGVNGNKHMDAIMEQYDPDFWFVHCVPLFDASGGAGVLPSEWPRPCYFDEMEEADYHGYAGGLGPQNLAEQLPKIAAAAAEPDWLARHDPEELHDQANELTGPAPYWIDMETHVRSEHDRQFDLAKVRRCLEICAPHIQASDHA